MKRILSLAMAMILLVTMFSGCGSSSSNVIKIGFAGPLSGASGQVGAACYNGALMAFYEMKEELESISGCTLEFVTNDDQSDPTVAVTIGNKMASDKDVLVMIGHCNSSCTIASSAITVAADLGMVTGMSTNNDVTDRGLSGMLRVCARDDFQGKAAAKFCMETLGAKTAFIVNDQQSYGAGLAEQFITGCEAYGLTLIANEGIVSNEVDFSAVVNNIAAAKPDVVFYAGNYPEGSLLLKQMRDKGITSYYVGGDGVDTGELVNIAGAQNAVGAIYCSMTPAYDANPDLAAWCDRYKAQSGMEADGYAVYFYEAATVALTALKNAMVDAGNKRPTRKQVISALEVVEVQGLTCNFMFDEKGDNINAAMYAYEIVNGYPGVLKGELKL